MKMIRVLKITMFFCAALLPTLSSCTGSDRSSAALDDAKGESVSVDGIDIILVKGTQTCIDTFLPGGKSEDGANVRNERFTCTDVMSDPRVSGKEVLEVQTLIYESHSGRWKAEGTIVNDEGSWQGSGAGVAFQEGSSPYNYGEMVYTGEGVYAGWTYRYLIAGSNEGLVIVGWIEPAGSSE